MKTVYSWWILQRSEKTEKRNWNFIFLKLQDFVKRILIKLKEKSGVVKMIILSFLQSRFLMDLFLTDIIICCFFDTFARYFISEMLWSSK